jgi:hypothetical protein
MIRDDGMSDPRLSLHLEICEEAKVVRNVDEWSHEVARPRQSFSACQDA